MCDKHMKMESLRQHTASQHSLTISKYKEQFGNQLVFIRKCYHFCKICGKEVLLTKDNIGAHVRTHKWSLKQYNKDYMKGKAVKGKVKPSAALMSDSFLFLCLKASLRVHKGHRGPIRVMDGPYGSVRV